MILRDHVTTINQKHRVQSWHFVQPTKILLWDYCQTTQYSKLHTSTCTCSELNLGAWRDGIWSPILVRLRTRGMNLQPTKTVDVPGSRMFQAAYIYGVWTMLAFIIALGHFPRVTNETTSQLQRPTKIFYASYVENRKGTVKIGMNPGSAESISLV